MIDRTRFRWAGSSAIAVFVLLTGTLSLKADLSYFTSSAALHSAIFANPNFTGVTDLGIEDLEDSNLTAGNVAAMNDPLTQGSVNGPYPSGLVKPLTFQSNRGGGAPSNLDPRGTDGLGAYASGVNFGSGPATASDVVVTNTAGDSFDIIFTPFNSNIVGVGFNPIFVTEGNTESTVQVRVYDTANNLLNASAIATVTGDRPGTYFFGIQSTSYIGRVNLFATEGGNEGADNIVFYSGTFSAVPEPTSFVLVGIGGVGLALSALRRKIKKHKDAATTT